MKLFLYAHGGSCNHGCEAIVRTTAELFREHPKILYSNRPDEDIRYHVDSLYEILDTRKAKPNKASLRFLMAYLALKIKDDYMPLNRIHVFASLRLAPQNAVILSVGGDNYCFSGARQYMEHNAFLKKRGHKTVLWGCSVEPELIDQKMRQDLARYDLIVSRESITYDALRHINPNTILCADPAFSLPIAPGNRPGALGRKPYIGVNVSPLIQTFEDDTNMTMSNYRSLVRCILESTDRDIALIPHVVWSHNDDRIPLGQLYEEFKDTGRVFLVEDQNCMQLKDIISGCEFFVGARTHSTIAAYSTCVPTLVVGYSVKARGIARDLFGTEEGYVLPVQRLKKKEDLTQAFRALYARREEIREHLSDMMPCYIQSIQKAKEAVERL